MLITIKLACGFDNAHAGESFQVNCDADESVFILKYIIQESLAMNVSIEDQKLVYAGVILENDKKLSTYNIDEKKFIVLLINKLTSSPLLKLNTNSNNTDEKDNKVEENNSSSSVVTPSTSSVTTATLNGCNNKENANTNNNTSVKTNENSKLMSSTKTDNDYETKKKQMMEMGYCKELVEQSLLVSFDNPERAVQYLLEGIPYNIFQSFDIEHLKTINQQLRNNSTDQSNSEQSIHIFRDIPQLQSLCKFLQKHPEQLNDILLLVAQKHPSLFELISTQQALFVQMLNEPIPDAEENHQHNNNNSSTHSNGASGSGNELAEIINEYNKANNTNIEFTSDDRESLHRLQLIGCSVDEAFKVYIACERSEIYAANILLSDKK